MSVTSKDDTLFQFQGNLGRTELWPTASTTKEVAFGVPGVYGYQVNLLAPWLETLFIKSW